MHFFSTDRRSREDGGLARSGDGSVDQRFLPSDRTGWLRLALVVLLGVAAMLAPRVVASTGALYTDSSTVSGDVTATPSISP